jgi:anthranilate synthase component 1
MRICYNDLYTTKGLCAKDMIYPSREDFIRKSSEGNLIPVYKEILADRLTPVSAYEKIAWGAGSFLLESVEGGERIARYSFIGGNPFLVLKSKGRQVTITEGTRNRVVSLSEGEDPLTVLKKMICEYRYVQDPGIGTFSGGAVGFLSYDIVRFFEKLPDKNPDDLNLPDCCFFFTDTMLIFDHVKQRIKVLCNARVQQDAAAAYDRAVSRIEGLIARLRSPWAPPASLPSPDELEITPNQTQEQYESAVTKCKEYIASGDAFQVVPSQRWAVRFNAKPFELYRALRSINPSPYLYFLEMGDKQVVGSSPEILVTVKAGKVRVRPIAGTRPRGKTDEEDIRLERELLADEKERAEHVMLIDLGRNDVGRVSKYGTVKVTDLMTIERYSHVMHIVSNVVGELAEDKDVFDALRACFPAGTLTGAPKVRAMEIIDEVEPNRRGLYGGAVGYFSFSGDADFAIAIRTMLVDGNIAYIQAGGGVVADSTPSGEYQESVNKSRALISAIEMAQAGIEG